MVFAGKRCRYVGGRTKGYRTHPHKPDATSVQYHDEKIPVTTPSPPFKSQALRSALRCLFEARSARRTFTDHRRRRITKKRFVKAWFRCGFNKQVSRRLHPDRHRWKMLSHCERLALLMRNYVRIAGVFPIWTWKRLSRSRKTFQTLGKQTKTVRGSHRWTLGDREGALNLEVWVTGRLHKVDHTKLAASPSQVNRFTRSTTKAKTKKGQPSQHQVFEHTLWALSLFASPV